MRLGERYDIGAGVKRTTTTLIRAIPVAFAALGALLIVFWLRVGPPDDVRAREPEEQAALPSPSLDPLAAGPPGVLTLSDGKPADLPGSWPGFRGPDFDNVGKEAIPLAREWPEGGPPLLWSVDLGEGYAGAAVRAGRVYILDYDQKELADSLRCLSLADGREIWRRSYPVRVKRQHGMSRTVPAVTDRYVVTLGPKCHVMCVDAETGEFRWSIDLVKEFGAKVPAWYAGECPLIEDGRAIIATGGGTRSLSPSTARRARSSGRRRTPAAGR